MKHSTVPNTNTVMFHKKKMKSYYGPNNKSKSDKICKYKDACT